MPDFSIENKYKGTVAGIDEAGRGPWCGPVVASAVVLDFDEMPPLLASELEKNLNDSKKLSEKKREYLFERICSDKSIKVGVGISSVEEIDSINILKATFLAMKRAVEELSCNVDVALIDGNKAPELGCETETVVKGDSRSLSIAAASIVAKVTRDRMMKKLAEEFPGYGWERNMGYGTKEHKEAISTLGITVHHRKSYAPIRQYIKK